MSRLRCAAAGRAADVEIRRGRRFAAPAPVIVAVLLGSACVPVFAQAPADAGRRAELRAEIQAERDAAEALYRQRVQECDARFVVSSCVEAARKERHDTLKRLGSRQAALDDAEREERAAERREAIAQKEREEQARQREAQARMRSGETQRDAAGARGTPPAARESPPHPGKPPLSAQERAAQEARARNAFALKQLQAEARRQETERRNAEHARKTKPAAPLPDPASPAPAPSAASVARPAPAASAASAH